MSNTLIFYVDENSAITSCNCQWLRSNSPTSNEPNGCWNCGYSRCEYDGKDIRDIYNTAHLPFIGRRSNETA